MHMGPPDVASHQNLENLKIQDGRQPPSGKMEKSRYRRNCLTDFDEI